MTSPTISTRFAAAEAFLYGRFNFERLDVGRTPLPGFRLETIRRLLERINNPHLNYPVLHVAGTKGKGSVVTLTAAILSAAGLRVGLYRSPHLESVRERISIYDSWISPEHFADVIEKLCPEIAHLDRAAARDPQLHPPTFFEIVTSAAMEYFHQQRVDVALFEVGMGGRLDSTNICRPLLTMITNIGLDHQRQLGATKSKIAAEKAGIIKPGIALLCGVRETGPARVVAEIATQQGSPVFWSGRDFGSRLTGETPLGGLQFTAWGERPHRYLCKELGTRMYGRHQVTNAAMAVAAAHWLINQGWDIDEAAVRRGLQSAQIDARFQIFPGCPPIVVDVAHNAMSARVFTAALQARFPNCHRRVLIFSASKDKRLLPMFRTLFPLFERVILTSIYDNPRACDLTALGTTAEQARNELQRLGKNPAVRLELQPDQTAAFAAAQQDGSDLIAICGSVFLAGQMLPAVRQIRPDCSEACRHGFPTLPDEKSMNI